MDKQPGRQEMLAKVRKQLTEHRYQHTLGVMETAIHLSEKYGADPSKSEVAAIFHDYAKFWSADKMRSIIEREPSIPNDLLTYHKELWHAPVGAIAVQHEIGINDEAVLNAIRYHTTGRAGMTTLEKVICLADYIEPSRSFSRVQHLRYLAQHNLDAALYEAINGTIQLLQKQGQSIYPWTMQARDDLKKRMDT